MKPRRQDEKKLSLSVKIDDAFEEIFAQYAPKLYFFSLRILRNEAEAEEIVQDTFLRVLENRAEIDFGLNFGAYLLTIAKHKIFNLYRRRVMEMRHGERIASERQDLSPEEIEPRLEDFRDLVRERIDKLPPQQREAIKLKLQGLDNGEIAERLSVTKKTVENHLNRAYKQLRAQLGEWRDILPLTLALIFHMQ